MSRTHPDRLSKRKKAYWIDKDEIKKQLKSPHVEKIGMHREFFIFDDLNKFLSLLFPSGVKQKFSLGVFITVVFLSSL